MDNFLSTWVTYFDAGVIRSGPALVRSLKGLTKEDWVLRPDPDQAGFARWVRMSKKARLIKANSFIRKARAAKAEFLRPV